MWFYGITIIVGHIMPNTFYTYIQYMISRHFVYNIFKRAKAHFLTHSWFHLISNHSI